MSVAKNHSVVAIYGSHAGAKAAVKVLQAAGIDTSCLSIVGKGFQPEDHAVGFYPSGDRMNFWGGRSAIEGAVLGGTVGVIAAALTSIGIPEDSILKYELEMKAGKFLVLAHGSAAVIEHAGRVFRTTRAAELVAHAT